jgi:hypothetical protein
MNLPELFIRFLERRLLPKIEETIPLNFCVLVCLALSKSGLSAVCISF